MSDQAKEEPGQSGSRCPQCGAALSSSTRPGDGAVVCPLCAHSSAAFEAGDRSTQVFLSETASSDADERFVVAGALGHGGFGVVVKAFDRTLRRYVAIKAPRRSDSDFDPDLFLLEARAASALRHPNVVTVYDVGMREGRPFIVSECIEGVTLRNWMEGSSASYEAIAKLASKLCRAIAYAHSKGIVHRDIKPSNVVVDDRDEPHVLDFGLSKSRSSGEAALFRQSAPFGTPAYMSPEQARGDSKSIGKHSDIYALGVVLYQMLTRRLPFMGSPRRIFDLILNEEPVRPRTLDPRIPSSLEAIALKAMQKDIDRRYDSADALADDLDRFLDGRPVAALGRHDVRSLAMTARRGFIGTVAAAATCGLLGVAGWFIYRSYRDDPRIRVRLADGSGEERITWTPFDDLLGVPLFDREETVAGDETASLVPGLYRVVAQRGDAFAEVWRVVPPSALAPGTSYRTADGRVLRPKWLTWSGDAVVTVPGIEFVSPSRRKADLSAAEFLPESSVTYESELYPTLSRDYRIPAFYLGTRTSTVAEVIAEFGDSMGNVGPPGAEALLTIEFAIDFAERRGARLMTAWEWYVAVTNGGSTDFPWGDEALTGVTSAAIASVDVCRDHPSIVGLLSGKREWTETLFGMSQAQANAVRRDGRSANRRWLTVGVEPPVGPTSLSTLASSTVGQFIFSDEGSNNALAVRLAWSAQPPA